MADSRVKFPPKHFVKYSCGRPEKTCVPPPNLSKQIAPDPKI